MPVFSLMQDVLTTARSGRLISEKSSASKPQGVDSTGVVIPIVALNRVSQAQPVPLDGVMIEYYKHHCPSGEESSVTTDITRTVSEHPSFALDA